MLAILSEQANVSHHQGERGGRKLEQAGCPVIGHFTLRDWLHSTTMRWLKQDWTISMDN